MTTLRERARVILGYIYERQRMTDDDVREDVDFIERHLREACEEAVREERENTRMGRLTKSDPWPEVPELPPGHKINAQGIIYRDSAPAAEDVLKRIVALESNVATQRDLDGVAFREMRQLAEDALRAVRELANGVLRGDNDLIRAVQRGVCYLLEGRRDTEAARSITGESAINSSKTTEGK